MTSSAGRWLCGVGGVALLLQAFLPTYVLGHRRGLYSPVEVVFLEPAACFVTWIALLPNLMGLHALVLAAGRVPGPTALKLYRGFIWILVAIYAWCAFISGLLTAGFFAGRGDESRWLVTGGAFVGTAGVLVVAARSVWKNEVRLQPPFVQMLLYQGILLVMCAPWLFIPLGEGVTVGGVVGALAWATLLVGSHLWVRALLRRE